MRSSTWRPFAAALFLAAAAHAGDLANYPQPIAPGASNDGQLAAFDVNGDGLKDLLVTDWNLTPGEKTFSIMLSTGVPLTWSAPQTAVPGHSPYDMVAVDFDGDGDTDLASTSNSANRLNLMPNQANGSLGPLQQITLSMKALQVEVGDTDQDGDLDFVMDRSDNNNGFFVVRNDGAGQFAIQPTVMATVAATSVCTGDMDNDGLVDALMRSNIDVFTFVVARGTGGNQFVPGAVSPTLGVMEFFLGDFDGDAWLDVAEWTTNPPYVWVQHGTGGGSLGPVTAVGGQPAWGAHGVYGLAGGDVDGDGDDDLAMWSLPGGLKCLAVARTENGTVSVPPGGVIPLPDVPFAALISDVDADGLADLLSGDVARQLVLTHGVPGGFDVPQVSTVPDFVLQDHVIADFTQDGCADVLVQLAVNTAVVPGSAASGFTAPIPSSLFAFLQFWWPRASGDFDGDGLPDAVGAVQIGATLGLRVVRGLGDGTLANGPDSVFEDLITHAEAADLDLDGDLDLAASRGFYFARYLNDGAASFSQLLIVSPFQQGEVHAADLNADGLPDVVSGLPSQNALAVRLNLGGGVPGPMDSQAGFNPDFALGDIDGDGQPEIVGGRFVAAGQPDVFAVRALPGGGYSTTALASSQLAATTHPAIVGVADATGDGLADVLAASGSKLALLRSAGPGGVATGRPSCLPPGSTSTLDANGDGAVDVLVVEAGKLHLLECDPGQQTDAWTSLGFALAGSSGSPSLFGSGTLAAGTAVAVDLSSAKPSAPALLIVGNAALMMPWKSGTLVPVLTFATPLVVGAGGTLHLAMTMPAGVPGGTSIYLQIWIQDAAGPSGFAASNALRAITP